MASSTASSVEIAHPDLHCVMRPGIMLSQNWRPLRSKVGEVLKALDGALEFPFFTEYQTIDIADVTERRAIAETLRRAQGALSYSFGRLQYEEGMNLSSLDDAVLGRSRDLALQHLDAARETGAQYVQLISGTAPADPNCRAQALDTLEMSLRILVERAASLSLMLLVEALDVRAHKKATLGFINEALDLVRCVDGPAFGLCVDTAHMKLNGEIVEEHLRELGPVAHEFHFCNCVCEPSHPLFGDQHIPIGLPGWLDVPAIARILSCGLRDSFWSPTRRMRTFCETKRLETMAPGDLVESIQHAFEQAWVLVQQGSLSQS